MPKKFRIIIKVPAILYAVHDIEADSVDALTERLQQQSQVDKIVADGEGFVREFAEPDESDLNWSVDEIGLEADTAAT